MKPLAAVYAILAILGLIIPYYKFLPWISAHGLDFGLFLEQSNANRVTTLIALDATMGGIAAAVFAFIESFRQRIRLGYFAGAAALIFGAGVGLPLFLFLRELRKSVQTQNRTV